MQQADWLPDGRARTEWVTRRGKVKYSFIGGPLVGQEARVVTASSVLAEGGHTLDEKGLEPHTGVRRGPVKAKGEGHVGASGLCCFPGSGRQNKSRVGWRGAGAARTECSVLGAPASEASVSRAPSLCCSIYRKDPREEECGWEKKGLWG